MGGTTTNKGLQKTNAPNCFGDWQGFPGGTETGKPSQVALVLKNLPANAGDVGDMGSIPASGRSPGQEGVATHSSLGNPLQSSCLENPKDRGASRATAHRVSQSQTQLQRLSMHTHVKGSSKSDAIY